MATAPATYTLDFNEAEHVYRLNGQVVPSVTQILSQRRLYLGNEWWTEEARARGTAAHIATQLYDEGDLDMGTLAPEIAPYLDAWVQFLADSRFEVVMNEQKLASLTHGFAGTLDRFGRIDGKGVLVDIKTGQWQPAYALQLAGYHYLLTETGETPARYLCVSLRADGTYRTKELSLTEIYRAQGLFLAALNLTKWIGAQHVTHD